MLIATVEDVLRAVAKGKRICGTFPCDGWDAVSARGHLRKWGLTDAYGAITPRGHEYIARAEAGWV